MRALRSPRSALRRCRASARVLCCTAAPAAERYQIRLARSPEDARQVADICAAVFIHEKFQQQLQEADSDAIRGLVDGYAERVRTEVHAKLQESQERKRQVGSRRRPRPAHAGACRWAEDDRACL